MGLDRHGDRAVDPEALVMPISRQVRAALCAVSLWGPGMAFAATGAPAPQPPLDPPPAPAPQNWLPRGNAEIRAVNKIDAHVASLQMHVGQTVHFGALSMTLDACLARPADEVADAAAYIRIEDSHPGAPGFSGWVLANEPQVNMLEHPIYGVRLLACR